jgi:hypothetical protein
VFFQLLKQWIIPVFKVTQVPRLGKESQQIGNGNGRQAALRANDISRRKEEL